MWKIYFSGTSSIHTVSSSGDLDSIGGPLNDPSCFIDSEAKQSSLTVTSQSYSIQLTSQEHKLWAFWKGNMMRLQDPRRCLIPEVHTPPLLLVKWCLVVAAEHHLSCPKWIIAPTVFETWIIAKRDCHCLKYKSISNSDQQPKTAFFQSG